MRKLIFCLSTFWLMLLVYSTKAQGVVLVDFDTLLKYYSGKNDTTYIINFFASWCAPCIKEIPEFVKFGELYKSKKVRVIFVSLDFKNEYEKTLIPLIDKYKITQTVLLLDEAQKKNWIDMVDKKWSGSLPATLFINNKKKFRSLATVPLTSESISKKIKHIVYEK